MKTGVMNTRKVAKRAQFILDIAIAMAKRDHKGEWQVLSALENVGFHNGYSEKGYSTGLQLVATGNWNEVTRWIDASASGQPNRCELVSNLPKRVGDLFKKLGIEIEWEDEWTSCHECGKLVRTCADSHCWTPSYWEGGIDKGEMICLDCHGEDEDEDEDEGVGT